MYFSIVPYGSKEIRLTLVDQSIDDEGLRFQRGRQKEKVAASFTLKNLLVEKPQDWKPEALPIKREMDLATVQLTSVDPKAMESAPPRHMGEYAGFEGGFGPGGFQRGRCPYNCSERHVQRQ